MTRDIPFGLTAGMKLTDFPQGLTEVAPGIHNIPVPRPHPDFPSYLGMIGPTTGLQWIKAVGKEIRTNRFGTALRSAFDDFALRLAKAYGEGRLDDILLTGALWNEPEDFMNALLRGERALMMTWDEMSGSTIEAPMASISLLAIAVEDDLGYLAIEYSLDRMDEMRREIEAAQDDVL